MNKLKRKMYCLYFLDVVQLGQMHHKSLYTKFLLIFLFLLVVHLPIFSQMTLPYYCPNTKDNFNLTPYLLQDSCTYFPEGIFTIGHFPIGTKIAQSDTRKNIKRNNTKYYEVQTENDTTFSKGNKIISIRETEKGDKMAIYLQVENMDQQIKLIVYNLLGKKVLEIYEGKPKEPSQPYEFSINELPKGIFLLVVIGENFRLREKLIITK